MKNTLFTILAITLLTKTSLAEATLIRGENTTNYPTIQAAINEAQPGDTVQVGQGHYHEQIFFVRSGKPDRPITLEGKPGEYPIIDGADPAFQIAPNFKSCRWEAVLSTYNLLD